MKNLTLWVGLLGLLLFPLTAQAAQTWQKSCQGGAWNATTSASRGKWVCNDSVANTNSNMLYVGDCENFDVTFASDLGQSAGAGTTVNIYSCMSPTDATGDGPTDAGWLSTTPPKDAEASGREAS